MSALRLDTMIGEVARLRRSVSASVLVGLGVTLAALAVRLEFEWLPRGSEFVTFFPALAVVACLCGWQVALGAIVLAALASWWLFLGGGIGDTNTLAEVVLFVAGSAAVVAMVEALTRAAVRGAHGRRAEPGTGDRTGRVVAAYLAAVAAFDEAVPQCGCEVALQDRLAMLHAIAGALNEPAAGGRTPLQRACEARLDGGAVAAVVRGSVPAMAPERLAAIAIVVGEIRMSMGTADRRITGTKLDAEVAGGASGVTVDVRAIGADGDELPPLPPDGPSVRRVERLARRLGATLVAVDVPPLLRISFPS